MPLTNGMLFDKKLRKVLVRLFVCKKQNVPLLTRPLFETLPLDILTDLNSSLLWVFRGGILVLWNSSIFSGDVVELKPYSITIDFTATHDQSKWRLSSIYGPCHQPLRSEFVN